MKKNSRTGSRLFFLEFLIVIFFFLIISTICLKLFVSAKLMTQNAAALSRAQQISSSIAELFESSASTEASRYSFYDSDRQTDKTDPLFSGSQIVAEILAIFPQYVCEPSAQNASANCFFDRNFEPCEKEKAFYTINVSVQIQENDMQLSITALDHSQTLLYELPVTFHTPFTKGDAS